MLTSRHFDEAYYREHKAEGLDYCVCGRWQREYGRWLVDVLGWRLRTILDVGCACGAIARGLLDAGAHHVCGVDLCEPMILRGREHHAAAPALRLDVCDAVNLHLFNEGDFDGLHSAQVAEHWRPHLVPHILEELRRVAKPGASLFLALDTAELFSRQGRSLESGREDPTHVCIKPLAWWVERIRDAGWERREWAEIDLKCHPVYQECFAINDWDFLVCVAE